MKTDMEWEWYDELSVDEHGGQCCGIYHLFDFYDGQLQAYDYKKHDYVDRDATLNEKVEFIARGVKICTRSNHERMAIEVTLIQDQRKTWERALQRCGFRRVFRFVNGNTGNTVYVYFLATNQPEKKKTESLR